MLRLSFREENIWANVYCKETHTHQYGHVIRCI